MSSKRFVIWGVVALCLIGLYVASRRSASNRLLKNSLLRGFVSGHDFSRADKSFVLVIPSGLQPARDLLFALFQQPVKPWPFPTPCSARLKSCPDTTPTISEMSPSH